MQNWREFFAKNFGWDPYEVSFHFVKSFIDRYGFERMLSLIEKLDNFQLKIAFKEVTKEDIHSFVADWHKGLEGVKIPEKTKGR